MANYKFIVNPTASRGKGQKVGELLKKLAKDKKLDFDLEFTHAPLHASEIANKSNGQFEYLVAVGGDGTINEVVNGLDNKIAKFGVIPVGSGNDFVSVLNIPKKLSAALATLINRKTRLIDIGKAGDVYFANGLGIGFDAWVVEQSFKVKKLRGNAIYLYSVLRTIYSYSAPVIKLSYNETVINEKLFMVTVGNGVSMGGGFKLTPNAELDDGLFDLNIISDLTKFEIYHNLLSVYAGKHTQMPQVTTARASHLKLESGEGFAAHVDGELISLHINELDVQLLPKALEVVVPEN